MRLAAIAQNKIRRAFTLVEMLIVVGIMGLASAGIVAFVHQVLLMYYSDRAQLIINSDLRSFTQKIDIDAVSANYFRIYPSFSTLSTSSGSTWSDASVANGMVGDFLVLVYTDPAETTNGTSMINQLVGYYRNVTNTTLNTGPVCRFAITISPSVAANSAPMYQILQTYVTGSASSYPIITQIAQGLEDNTATTSTPTPKLFYDLENRSIMINAQISELEAEQGNAPEVGNTYNFTISPRG